MADEPLVGGVVGDVQRRTPSAAGSAVGTRGRRARQRILDAALVVFAELGYHRCGVSQITEAAGCSRAAFYQYFSSKEDVFRQLAGQVSRQLAASAEALDPIGPDLAGWTSLRAWIDRHHAIYRRYEPVFRVFQDATASDTAVARGTAAIRARDVAIVQAKLTSATLPDRHVGDVVALGLSVMSWTPRLVQVLQAGLGSTPVPQDRLAFALADIVHRTLFGLRPDVNVRAAPDRGLPRLDGGPTQLVRLEVGAAPKSVPRQATLDLLAATARDMLAQRGYHGTTVDDIRKSAGFARGAFYRYFESRDHIVRFVAYGALQEVYAAFDAMPEPGRADPAALRRWLRRFEEAQTEHVAVVRAWFEATMDDPAHRTETAAALDVGWRRLVRFLTPRGFGDVDADALLAISLLDALGGIYSAPVEVEAAALVIERGLLGR